MGSRSAGSCYASWVDGMSVESKLYLFWICLFVGIFLILEAAQ